MSKTLQVDIVIPVYNEAEIILNSITQLKTFCEKELGNYSFKIIVADNASTDGTYEKVMSHYSSSKVVSAIKIIEKGRGRALLKAWGDSKADICCYMDADLSTDLKHLPIILDKVANGYDIAVGSRHSKKSQVERGLKRRIIGSVHVLLMKAILGVSFSDPYCGFKAASRKAIHTVFPMINPNKWQINGNAWFWDTEFLVNAEKMGLRIYEEPVSWKDDPSSTARIFQDSVESLRGMWRLRMEKPWN